MRTQKGKKNRSLRKSGLIPAVIYGEGQSPLSVSINARTFATTYKQAGETSLVECVVDGATIPTLISDVSVHPDLETVLHVDFRKVNLAKKVEVDVPVEFIGESAAVKSLGGVLLQQMQEVQVEAFPQNIPAAITIDISTLADVGSEIKVSDLPTSSTYVILDEPDRVVVSIIAHKEESTEVQTDRAEVEITTAKKDEEGAEGESTEAATPADADASKSADKGTK